MWRERVLEQVRELEPTLRQRGFGKLYLFGSVARGEANPNDVDLLFEADPENDPSLFGIWETQDQLAEQLGRRVELVDRALLHERIRPRVEAEMIEVY
jgi:predicted nucleotidyltransferase